MPAVQREQRVISGRGILKVPQNALSDRYHLLHVQVIRPPKNLYLNRNYNPPRGKYAFLTFLKSGRVLFDASFEYPSQTWTQIPDVCGQTLIAVKCAYQGLLESFANQNRALLLTVTSFTNAIDLYPNLSLGWDEVRFVCYADTAIVATLMGEGYQSCNANYTGVESGSASPAAISTVGAGQAIPLNISRPYDPSTNDGGSTAPYSSDGFAPLKPSDVSSCQRVRLTLRVTRADGTTQTVVGRDNQGGLQYAPIVGVNILNNNDGSYLRVVGGASVGTIDCNGRSDYLINYLVEFNFNRRFLSAEIINTEVVP